ncbi:uncharacterized protein LOC135480504 [Liolophura sinensis]|uniref:uncharacterized protein LOC135480504 n=1 Tax=Liolophura sinensis TaxID=3198878 RepID=UPI00315943C5
MMQQNSRRGGRPSRFEPSSLPGAGLLGDAPGRGGFPAGFNPANTSLLGQAPGPGNRSMQMPSFGSAGQGTGMGVAQSLMGMGGAKGGNQQMANILQHQNGIMGNFLQQQQQQQHQQRRQQPQMQQPQQQQRLPTQNIRDTQLNIVNSLLKGAMSNQGASGQINNQMRAANSILGNFPRPPGSMPGGIAGMKGGNFGAQNLGQMAGLGRKAPSGLGLLDNPPIPSIFNLNTNPTNQLAQRKRAGMMDGRNRFEPDVKRYRKDLGQFSTGGSFSQIPPRTFDRPDNRNDRHDNNLRRSVPRFAGGRRDSSGSSHSDRSQNSRWQPAQGGSTQQTRDVYDPAEPTDDQEQRRGGSTEGSLSGETSPLGLEEGDGDFSVTVDKTGRSISDKKEERKQKSQEKKSPYFCHTCKVECNNKANFTSHMQSEFHQERLQDLLNLTKQKSSQLQARLKAEAHLRTIEEKDINDREGYCQTCDEPYTGSVIRHRRTSSHKQRDSSHKSRWEHNFRQRNQATVTMVTRDKTPTAASAKMKEKVKWPRCSVCDQTFKSPLKFVKHLNSLAHKSDTERSDEGHLDQNKNDADEADMDETETRPTEGDETQNETAIQGRRDCAVVPVYDGVTVVGQEFVVPVSGFFCKLCYKFYNKETTARVTHCLSKTHYDRYQEFVASKGTQVQNTVKNEPIFIEQSPAEKTVFAQSADTASVQSVLKENGVKVRDDDKTPKNSPDEVEMLQRKEEEKEDSDYQNMHLSEKDEEMLLAEEENEQGEECTQEEMKDDLSDAASPETRRSTRSRRSRHSRKT